MFLADPRFALASMTLVLMLSRLVAHVWNSRASWKSGCASIMISWFVRLCVCNILLPLVLLVEIALRRSSPQGCTSDRPEPKEQLLDACFAASRGRKGGARRTFKFVNCARKLENQKNIITRRCFYVIAVPCSELLPTIARTHFPLHFIFV